jgi:hypothetical protein
MKSRRQWLWMLTAVAFAFFCAAASQTQAFVESTDTDGELPTNIGGVWLVVTHLEFAKPTPTVGAGEPTPAASPAPKGAAAATVRYFNVVNLLRVSHLPKDEAQKVHAANKKLEEASIEKAKAIIAEEQKKSPPMQTETGEVQGEMKVLAPIVPAKYQPGQGDDVDVFLLDVAFPKAIQDAVDAAQKAEKPWLPTDKDLALLKSSWNTLKPSGRDEFSKIEWKVQTSDKFDDNLKLDATTKDAKFTITGNQEMIPKPNVPKTNIVVFGIEDMRGGVLSGKHTRAMMASAPFPIPIEMRGTFKMYKLVDAAKVRETSAPAKAAGAQPSGDKAAPAKKAKAKH